MMNLFLEMFAAYLMTCAASAYIIGFEVDGVVYMVTLPTLYHWMVRRTCSSCDKGKKQKIALNMTKGTIQKLLAMGAKPVGTVSEIMGDLIHDKGHGFERYIFRVNGQEWKRDNVPYYIDGDITIDGVKYQIKFGQASLTTYDCIRQAMGVTE